MTAEAVDAPRGSWAPLWVLVGVLGLWARDAARVPGRTAGGYVHASADQGPLPLTFLHGLGDWMAGVPDALLGLGPLHADVLAPLALAVGVATLVLSAALADEEPAPRQRTVTRVAAGLAGAAALPAVLAFVVGVLLILLSVVVAVLVWVFQVVLVILGAVLFVFAGTFFVFFWFAPFFAALTGIAKNIAVMSQD